MFIITAYENNITSNITCRVKFIRLTWKFSLYVHSMLLEKFWSNSLNWVKKIG